MPQQNQFQLYVLDTFSANDIKKWKKHHADVSRYCWDHFSYLAYKRYLIQDELIQSLIKNCTTYEPSTLCRVVDYRFSNHPLSAKGSILADPGGRFNIGDIDQIKFPKFSALYLAEDVETALREKCGLAPESDNGGLTGEELNLMGNTAIIQVKCKLNSVLNLTNPSSLHNFYNLVKTINVPFGFTKRANKLKIPPLRAVHSSKELIDTFLTEEWRVMPMNFDIPANPQILGQLAHAAGIEAIVYPSVKTKKICLAIYLENLLMDSFIEIEGEAPEAVSYKRIDKENYSNFI